MKSRTRRICDVGLQLVLLILASIASYVGHYACSPLICLFGVGTLANPSAVPCTVLSLPESGWHHNFLFGSVGWPKSILRLFTIYTLACSRLPPLATVAVYCGPLCMQIPPICRLGVGTTANATALRHKKKNIPNYHYFNSERHRYILLGGGGWPNPVVRRVLPEWPWRHNIISRFLPNSAVPNERSMQWYSILN